MRKTSRDGGDSTSITSGVENEIRKTVMKSKKSSLKMKGQNYSHDSDETVIEPLLQKEKDKMEINKSAKYFTTGKTDLTHDKDSGKTKLLNNSSKATTSTGFCGTTESLLSMKEYDTTKTNSSVVAPIHNYMNTNVFNTHDNSKAIGTAKTQILVEIDGSKQSGYSPSPLIFTTAKIHTDAKSKHMEPVQMTPVPIISTIEVSMTKEGVITTNEKVITNGSSVINPVYSSISFDEDKEEKSSTCSSNAMTLTTDINKDTFGKLITAPTAVKLSSHSSVKSSKENNTSTTSKSVISPQVNSFNLGSTKNNVTVKSSPPLFEKVNMVNIPIKSSGNIQGDIQSDQAQINKLVANSDNKSTVNSKNDTLNFVANIKSPTTSKNYSTISNTTKNISSTAGNKLQRQKTVTDDKNIIECKIKPDIERLEDNMKQSSAIISSLELNLSNSTSFKKCDKLPELSANNTQTAKLTLNTTANLNTNVTSISLTTKPTDSNVNLSNSRKNNICNISSNTGTNISSPKSPNNVELNISISRPAMTTTSAIKPVATTVAKISDIAAPAINSPDVTLGRSATIVGKVGSVNAPCITTSVVTSTISVNSVNSKSVSAPIKKTSVTSISIAGISKTANSTNKNPVSKSSLVNTSIKAASANSNTTKPTSSPQVAKSTKLPTTSATTSAKAKVSVVTTSKPTLPLNTVTSKANIVQNTTFAQANPNPPAKTSSVTTISKTSSATTSTKLSPTISNNTTIKSTNNISSAETIKSIPLVPTSKKSVVSSSITLPSITKAPLYTSSEITNDSPSSSIPSATKSISSTKKSPIISSPCESDVGTSKVLSSKTVSLKTTKPTTTTIKSISSTKTPSVISSTKTPSITSANISTSAQSTKTTPLHPTQTICNKTAGIASGSVASSDSVVRDSESVKNGGSKLNENNHKASQA